MQLAQYARLLQLTDDKTEALDLERSSLWTTLKKERWLLIYAIYEVQNTLILVVLCLNGNK